MNKVSEVIKYGSLETMLEAQTSRPYSKEVINHIRDLIDRNYKPVPKIVSSDVFDTLLIRSEKSEVKRFYEISTLVAEFLSSQNGKSFTTSDIFVLRQLANKLSYSLTGKVKGIREGSIREINRSIVDYLGYNSTYAEKLIEIEIEYEKQEITLNKPFWNFLKQMVKDGSKVVLVSDMYIHRNEIVSIIKDKVDDFEEVVHDLISSADTKINKASGHIFQYLKKKYSAKGEEIIHFGDAFVGDYQKPNLCGIRGVHLPLPKYYVKKLKEDEKLVLSKLAENDILVNSI